MDEVSYEHAQIAFTGAATAFSVAGIASSALTAMKVGGVCSLIPGIGWLVGGVLAGVGAGLALAATYNHYKVTTQSMQNQASGTINVDRSTSQVFSQSSLSKQADSSCLKPQQSVFKADELDDATNWDEDREPDVRKGIINEKQPKSMQEWQDIIQTTWFLEMMAKLLKENEEVLKRIVQIAKMQSMLLERFLQKVEEAIRLRSTRIIEEEFQNLNRSFQKGQADSWTELTPKQLEELLKKIAQFYSQPISPDVQKMLVYLFAKIEGKLLEQRQHRTYSWFKCSQNPVVAEAMAYVDKVSQQLLLELADLQEIKTLLELSNKKANEIGAYSNANIFNKKQFKALKKELNNIDKHTVHHIIPKKQIKDMLKGIVNLLPPEEALKVFNTLLNHSKNSKIKEYLTKKMGENKSQEDLVRMITNVFLAYFIWNPKNLVLGAFNDHRQNDPKSGQAIDSEILSVQGQMYRLGIRILRRALRDAKKATSSQDKARFYAKGLKTLCTLPWPINGEWVKNRSGKYELEESEPGREKLNLKGIIFDKISISEVVSQMRKDQQILENWKWTSKQIAKKSNEGGNQKEGKKKMENQPNKRGHSFDESNHRSKRNK